eukprot:455368-Amphidinium_carterae.1
MKFSMQSVEECYMKRAPVAEIAFCIFRTVDLHLGFWLNSNQLPPSPIDITLRYVLQGTVTRLPIGAT